MTKKTEHKEMVEIECTECDKIFKVEKNKKSDEYYILPVHHFKGHIKMCGGSGGYVFAQ